MKKTTQSSKQIKSKRTVQVKIEQKIRKTELIESCEAQRFWLLLGKKLSKITEDNYLFTCIKIQINK